MTRILFVDGTRARVVPDVCALFHRFGQERSPSTRESCRTYHADHMRLYGTDLAALSALSEPEHVLEDPIARKFLDNKASLRLTQYSFDLLVKFCTPKLDLHVEHS